MKWTRFKQEFDPGGTLSQYGKSDNLMVVPKTTIHAGNNDIWVSKDQNSIIDKCFRIYSDPASLEKVMDRGDISNKYPEKYHPWIYHGKDYDKLPAGYFYKDYFKEKSISNKYVRSTEGNVESAVENKKYYGLNHPYEIFIGGWVHFYDEEVRHGETDHALYFDWDVEKESVTVYILQTKSISSWNVYVKVNPPASQDPPPPKTPPPPCVQ